MAEKIGAFGPIAFHIRQSFERITQAGIVVDD